MPLNLTQTQIQEGQLSSEVVEARKLMIAIFESKYFKLSTLLKDRLLVTTDERFINKLNEMTYYATNGSVYTFAK